MKCKQRIVSALLIPVFFLAILPAGIYALPVFASEGESVADSADEEVRPEDSTASTEAENPDPVGEPNEGMPAASSDESPVSSGETVSTDSEETDHAEEIPPEDSSVPVLSGDAWCVICAVLLVSILLLILRLKRITAENRQLQTKLAELEAKESISLPKTAQHPPVGIHSAVTAPSFFAESISGFYAGQVIPVRQQVVFGRDPGCDIRYPNETGGISNVHCALIPDKGGVRLVDLGSRCGTFLGNGKQLQPHHGYILHHGDTFFLGNPDHSFRIK